MMAQKYSRFLGVIFEDGSNEVIAKRWIHCEMGQENCIKVLSPPGDVQSKAKKKKRNRGKVGHCILRKARPIWLVIAFTFAYVQDVN